MRRTSILLLLLLVPLAASAHPGMTDHRGGHQCLKGCAAWDLYYQEYHLHDKDGRPVKVAATKPAAGGRVRVKAAEAPVPEPVGVGVPAQPLVPAPARASVMPQEEGMPWSWLLLALFLLLFLAVRRRRAGEAGRQ